MFSWKDLEEYRNDIISRCEEGYITETERDILLNQYITLKKMMRDRKLILSLFNPVSENHSFMPYRQCKLFSLY